MSKILRIRSVIEKTGLSKSTLYEEVAADRFPRPIKLSKRTVGWLESDIDTWIKSLKRTDESSLN